MIDSIALITIYIAGADGKIDQDEVAWAKKITDIRSYSLPEGLKDFYKDVGEHFDSKLDQQLAELPNDVAERTEIIRDKLSCLNPILSKLPKKTGALMYKNYLSFAEHVAKASGGFLGMFSVNNEESKLLSLEMINEIVWTGEDSED